MSNADDPRTEPSDAASPWPADTFDRWLAALDVTDHDDDADDVTDAEGDGDGDGDRTRATAGAPDPWADLDLDPVDLSSDQREYLAWHDHQPSVPRLHGAAHEPDDT